MQNSNPSLKSTKLTFSEIKNEFHRLRAELTALSDKGFGEMNFEEARLLLAAQRKLEHEILDKLRLLNDFQILNRIPLETPK